MMNYNKKEQLLDKVDGLRFLESGQHMFWYNKAIYIACKRIEEFFDAEFIPEVPKYVADWYEDNKDELETNLFRIVFNMPKISENKKLSLFEEWLTDINTNSFQILINMHQFGYKIKKEHRYLVRMIGLDKDESYLKYNIKSDFWYLGTNEVYKNTRVKHTMKELEDNGFKEVFPSPLFEIVEVKE